MGYGSYSPIFTSIESDLRQYPIKVRASRLDIQINIGSSITNSRTLCNIEIRYDREMDIGKIYIDGKLIKVNKY